MAAIRPTADTHAMAVSRWPAASAWRQILVIGAAFVAYMGVRAIANGSEGLAYENARDLLAFEASLGIDWEVDIQRFVLDRGSLISFFNFVYVWLYWPMLVVTLVFTWSRRRRLFVLFRNALLMSGAAGLAIFTVIPMAPPRFLDGFVDTVQGSHRSYFVAHPSLLINRFAALPSFHVGWVALASAVLMLSTRRRWLRSIALVPPFLMSLAVVVTGNHYIVDVVAGVGICLGALAIVYVRAPDNDAQLFLDTFNQAPEVGAHAAAHPFTRQPTGPSS